MQGRIWEEINPDEERNYREVEHSTSSSCLTLSFIRISQLLEGLAYKSLYLLNRGIHARSFQTCIH